MTLHIQAFQCHLVEGQGSGLVHAQHGRRPEAFDGGHAPGEDSATAGDAPGAEGHEHGEDDGEFFGQDCHRQGDPSEQSLLPDGGPAAPGEGIGDHHHGAGAQPHNSQDPNQPPSLLLEARGFRLHLLQGLADLAELCLRASPDDVHHPLTGGHQGSREQGWQVIPPGDVEGLGLGRGHLANGDRLPREQGFVHGQIDAGPENGIGRNAIPFRHDHDISGNHVPASDSLLFATPDHQGPGAGKIPQSFQGMLRPPFLDDGDAHDHKDKPEEHEGILRRSHQQVEGARRHEQQEHGFADHLPGDGQDAAVLTGRQFVGPFARQAE